MSSAWQIVLIMHVLGAFIIDVLVIVVVVAVVGIDGVVSIGLFVKPALFQKF